MSMNPPYFVEILTRDGVVKSRHRFEHCPIRIGRAYDNDLIIDDVYMASHHAVVELSETGALTLRGLESKNGILVDNKRITESVIDEQHFRLGQTHLRIRDAAYPVKAELLDNSAYHWEGWPPALLAMLMIALSTIVSTWLTETETFSWIRYLSSLAIVFSAVFVWCGCWAFANRVIGSHGRFGRHLFVVACATLVFDLWNMASITFGYAFSLAFLTKYSNHVLVMIAAGMLFFHLSTINQQHSKGFLRFCAVLMLLGSTFILISNYQRNGRLADDLYMTHLLPPAFRLTGNTPVESFIQEALPLKAKLDQNRLNPATEGADNDLINDETSNPQP